MSLSTTKYEHITLDEKGVPIVAGTTLKVVEIVAEKIAYGWSPEELHFQHPYLTMGQIYSALAYYYDHSDELNKDIERRLKSIQQYMPSGKTPLGTCIKNLEIIAKAGEPEDLINKVEFLPL
ncbi:MAG: DUF433 domain-containing protein [Thermodesulfovibrionales bacterium]|nr:DUF433 domain-containing protein [Thermodesulfovibrionales bacterium]